MTGLLVVEGFWDALRLKELGEFPIGITSNQMTDHQLDKVTMLANQRGLGRVNLMYDANSEGDRGAKEDLWKLNERQIDTRIVWSQRMHGGNFANREPESLTSDEWDAIKMTLA